MVGGIILIVSLISFSNVFAEQKTLTKPRVTEISQDIARIRLQISILQQQLEKLEEERARLDQLEREKKQERVENQRREYVRKYLEPIQKHKNLKTSLPGDSLIYTVRMDELSRENRALVEKMLKEEGVKNMTVDNPSRSRPHFNGRVVIASCVDQTNKANIPDTSCSGHLVGIQVSPPFGQEQALIYKVFKVDLLGNVVGVEYVKDGMGGDYVGEFVHGEAFLRRVGSIELPIRDRKSEIPKTLPATPDTGKAIPTPLRTSY